MAASYEQEAFRFRNDDGTETTATWKAAENTNFTLLVDANQTFRLRIELQENNSTGTAAAFTIRYSKNGAAYATVTTATSDIKLVASGTVADATATTNQLTTSVKTHVNGQFDSNGTVANITINNQSTELEYCLQGVAANLVHGDTYDFRCYRGGTTALQTYTRTPRLTVVKTVTGMAAITLADSTSVASGSEVVGSLASTLANHTSAASGGTGPSGSANVTLANHTVAASGGTGPSGSAAVTLADHTSLATGGTGPSGTLAVTLANHTSAATGTVGGTPTPDTQTVGGSGRRGPYHTTLDTPRTLQRDDEELLLVM